MTTTRPTTSPVRNIALWVLQIVMAGYFLMSAMAKFTNVEPAASTFEAIGFGDWFRHLTGVLEVAGAVSLVVPPLAGLAGLALAVLMVFATLTEAFVSKGGVAAPLVLLALCAVIAWCRRSATARLWSRISAGR